MAEAIIFVGLQGPAKRPISTTISRDPPAHQPRHPKDRGARNRTVPTMPPGRALLRHRQHECHPSRACPYIREAKAAGFRVLAYFFDTPVRTAIGRNNHRKDKRAIPVPAILRAAKQLEPPSLRKVSTKSGRSRRRKPQFLKRKTEDERLVFLCSNCLQVNREASHCRPQLVAGLLFKKSRHSVSMVATRLWLCRIKMSRVRFGNSTL